MSHVEYEAGVLAWTEALMYLGNPPIPVIRHYYYTSTQGDESKREDVHDRLVSLGIEAPRVFHRGKTRASKQVDISLSVKMLSHAHRKNYDLAVLATGDEDYVPLVEAVEAEGCRVVLWAFENGLSTSLRRAVDHFFYLDNAFLREKTQQGYRKCMYW